jgi:hypothetical protein
MVIKEKERSKQGEDEGGRKVKDTKGDKEAEEREDVKLERRKRRK